MALWFAFRGDAERRPCFLSEGYACGVLAMFFAAPLKARFCGRYFGALFSSGKALFLLYDRKYICTYAHIYVLHTYMPYRAGRF